MTELLTAEESAAAAASGWALCDVYDMQPRRWRVMVLPTRPGQPPLSSAEQATSYVIAMARQNHPLPLKALRLMAAHASAKPV